MIRGLLIFAPPRQLNRSAPLNGRDIREKGMIVLVVLLLSLLIYRGIGVLGVDALGTWPAATRYALATILVFTASAHFSRMKDDLVRMVSGWVHWPPAIAYFPPV